jgi:hypothetical protein
MGWIDVNLDKERFWTFFHIAKKSFVSINSGDILTG